MVAYTIQFGRIFGQKLGQFFERALCFYLSFSLVFFACEAFSGIVFGGWGGGSVHVESPKVVVDVFSVEAEDQDEGADFDTGGTESEEEESDEGEGEAEGEKLGVGWKEE